MRKLGFFIIIFFLTAAYFLFSANPTYALHGKCDPDIHDCNNPIDTGTGRAACGNVRSMPAGLAAGCVKTNLPTELGTIGQNCSNPDGFYQWCGELANRGNLYCGCYPPASGTSVPTGPSDPCAGATGDALISCQDCLGWDSSNSVYTLAAEKSWTALGCIPNDPRDFIIWILSRAIGIGGGIAFLLMLFGGFQIITSAGNPERLNSGKDIIGSAITGLLLIIFSLFLLKLIGVDILGLENVDFKFGP
jgi:hypothetical protein